MEKIYNIVGKVKKSKNIKIGNNFVSGEKHDFMFDSKIQQVSNDRNKRSRVLCA